jgi:hypothetical protein
MKSSLQSLIVFLPSLLNRFRLPSQKTPSILSQLARNNLGADPSENTESIVIAQQYLDCCLPIRSRENLFTESLPINERLLWLHYSGFQVLCHTILIES